MRVDNNTAVRAINDNLPFFALEGTYVESGWSVVVGESGSAIEVDVDAGEGYLENSTISTTEQTVELSSGGDDSRHDLIYVAADESIEVLTGFEQSLSRDEDGNELDPETAPTPTPNSGASLNGIPIAHVFVPAGAENTADLEADHVFDIRTWVDISGSGSGESAADQRYITVGPVAIDDGDTAEAPLTVAEDDTITVTEWGSHEFDNGSKSNPPTGVRVALITPGGGTVNSEETPLTQDGDGIVSETATGTGPHHYSLRLINDSGSDFSSRDGQGLGAQFRVEIS